MCLQTTERLNKTCKLFLVHAMNTNRGRRRTAALILNVGTSNTMIVSEKSRRNTEVRFVYSENACMKTFI
jgi:hypothetical protein